MEGLVGVQLCTLFVLQICVATVAHFGHSILRTSILRTSILPISILRISILPTSILPTSILPTIVRGSALIAS